MASITNATFAAANLDASGNVILRTDQNNSLSISITFQRDALASQAGAYEEVNGCITIVLYKFKADGSNELAATFYPGTQPIKSTDFSGPNAFKSFTFTMDASSATDARNIGGWQGLGLFYSFTSPTDIVLSVNSIYNQQIWQPSFVSYAVPAPAAPTTGTVPTEIASNMLFLPGSRSYSAVITGNNVDFTCPDQTVITGIYKKGTVVKIQYAPLGVSADIDYLQCNLTVGETTWIGPLQWTTGYDAPANSFLVGIKIDFSAGTASYGITTLTSKSRINESTSEVSYTTPWVTQTASLTNLESGQPTSDYWFQTDTLRVLSGIVYNANDLQLLYHSGILNSPFSDGSSTIPIFPPIGG